MDILSNLTNLLGQASGGGARHSAAPRQAGAADPLGGLMDPNVLGGLVGALFGGGRTGGAAGGAGMGGLGSLIGMLMGGGGSGGGGGASAMGGLGALAGGGGAAGLLGALLGGSGGSAVPPPPPPPSPATATPAAAAANLLRTIVYAARADGHIDDREKAALSSQIQSMGLGREAQTLVDQAMREPLDPNTIARNITSDEEAVRLFALSCAVTEVDHPDEQRYIDALGAALRIPPETQRALLSRVLGR